jgi:hypothetical protein
MHDGLRSRKMTCYGTVLLVSWSLMPMVLPVAYSQQVPPQPVPTEPVPVQPVPPQPAPGQPPPAMTPTEAQKTRAADPETRTERKKVRPSETYVAGFAGATFDANLSSIEGTGFLSGLNLNDRDLKESVVYGGKIGHFFGNRMDWLGVEMEAFNTTPHVEQQGLVSGTHFRVTTLAFNLIGRLKLGCKTKTERTETRTERDAKTDRDIRYETQYEREFCWLQPYGGVGLGVFFANLSNNGNSVSDNGVPGFNALGGIRVYFTEHIALFGEYKYNYAAFDASTSGPFGNAGGFKGDYHANHVVGGLSFHF